MSQTQGFSKHFFLQVLFFCEAFIEETITRRNLFDYVELAYKYNLNYALNVTVQTLLDNFYTILEPVCDDSSHVKGDCLSRFLEMPADIIFPCFRSDTLVQSHAKSNASEEELTLFYLMCRWLEYKKERLKHSNDLLLCVRLANMSSEHVKEVSCHPLVLGNDKLLKRVLLAEEYLKDQLVKPLIPPDLHAPRGDLEFVFVEVAGQDEQLTFSCYNNRNLRTNHRITPISRGIMPLSVHSVHVGHFVYLLGILSGTGHYDNIMFRCHGSWDDEKCLTLNALEGSGRFWGAATYCDEHIYMVGGILMKNWMMSQETNFHRHVTATAFKYSIR